MPGQAGLAEALNDKTSISDVITGLVPVIPIGRALRLS